ncbi:hypothetical protein Tco_1101164, partial [Tanacetum coccineum]
DEPIIISNETEEEEKVVKDKDTEATSHDKPEDSSVLPPPSPKLAQIQELMAKVHLLQSQKEVLEQAKAKAKAEVASIKAKPSYPDINQLTELLVTSLKPELSKVLASHDFASCLPTELKKLPSKITGLFRDIIELKKHVRDMEIELIRDLKEIPTKLETFTSTISIIEKLQDLIRYQCLLHKVTDHHTRFAYLCGKCHQSYKHNVSFSSAGKATASPTKGEKNTKDDNTNLKDELVDLLGKNVVTQEVIQACPDKSEKGWKTIYDLVKTRLDQLTQTEQELKIDLNKPLKEQDPLNELNELANKKRKRTSDLKDHSSFFSVSSLGPYKIGKYLHFSVCSGIETEEGLLERASVQLGKGLLYVKRNKAISLENVTSRVGIEVHQLSLKDCTWKVNESVNMRFDETPPPSKTSPLVDDDLDEEEAIKVTEKKNLENDIED